MSYITTLCSLHWIQKVHKRCSKVAQVIFFSSSFIDAFSIMYSFNRIMFQLLYYFIIISNALKLWNLLPQFDCYFFFMMQPFRNELLIKKITHSTWFTFFNFAIITIKALKEISLPFPLYRNTNLLWMDVSKWNLKFFPPNFWHCFENFANFYLKF